MKLAICIPYKNQKDTVEFCLKKLLKQTRKPDIIIVVNDNSNHIPSFDKSITNKLCVIVQNLSESTSGRCHARNRAIDTADAWGCDSVIFLDGDTFPANNTFVEDYAKQLSSTEPVAIFGPRSHIHRPVKIKDISDLDSDTIIAGVYPHIEIDRYPSDLLTANMDNLALNKRFNEWEHSDLRIVSGHFLSWEGTADINERADMLTSGMISWSCNFGLNKLAWTQLSQFMEVTYGTQTYFDFKMFSDGWGYEDVAFGIDLHFAGVNISVGDESINIYHFMHNRSDNLHTHILGRHRIMERYRKITTSAKFEPLGHKWDKDFDQWQVESNASSKPKKGRLGSRKRHQ
jgi:glycosyltransferase involved in cell wall biosynthesis